MKKLSVVEVVRSTSDGPFRSLGVRSRRGLFVACISDAALGWKFDRIIHVKSGLAPEPPRSYGTDVARVQRLMSALEALPEMSGTAEQIGASRGLRLKVNGVLDAFHVERKKQDTAREARRRPR